MDTNGNLRALLFKDLCGRLPYGTKVNAANKYISTISSINIGITTLILLKDVSPVFGIDYVKPYLRPMSSMTEEEEKEFQEIKLSYHFDEDSYILLDWLNKKGFDYRGLIPMGLALEATKGMYNVK